MRDDDLSPLLLEEDQAAGEAVDVGFSAEGADFALGEEAGNLAGSESLVLGFDEFGTKVKTVMAEAPHGTAPALEGKNLANPMAMILAGAALLGYLDNSEADKASRAIYESVFEILQDGQATTDLGGSLSTTEFTNEVIHRVQSKLEVWSTLG